MKKLIFSYHKRFADIFDREKNKISKVIEDVDIHHIGSTSVFGLGGKGIIDIMIGVKNWRKLENVIKGLKNIGFRHAHPKEKGRVFLSRVGPTKLGDTHIHIVRKDGKAYKEFLLFRDYLRKNKREVKRFYRLKLKWAKKADDDRVEYNQLKESYVRKILSRVKQTYKSSS